MTEQAQTPRILVVDDQTSAAEMLNRLFTANGYEVLNAYNGEEALKAARQEKPDLILLDIMMPGMDGFEVLKFLRDTPSTADIPTIFITARSEMSDIEHGLRLGADDYIPKPVKPRELLARAKSKIESHKLREMLHSRTTDLEALLRVSEELSNQIDVHSLLPLLLYLVEDLIDNQVAAVYHFDDNQNVNERYINAKNDDYDTDAIDVEILFEQVEQGTAIAWQDEQSFLPGLPAGMAIGLSHSGELHGVIAVFSEVPYDDSVRRLFESIGRQATLALRNAELHQLKTNYADHLEEMVQKRTEELRSAHALLIRSEKLASAGRLAAGIAHEINNPLQPILVNLELMLEDIQAGQPIVERDIEESLKSAKRIGRIVERLLQFTRKRSDGLPDMEPLNIRDVLDDVIALSRTYIKRGGIAIEVDVDPDAFVFGNRDQLEQVFLNLIVNAKAALVDGGVLKITTDTTEKDLIMRFEDDGIGIEADMIDKIFEPFYSTKDDGSGLGLFISYGIIQDHNGGIDVVSEVGKGTTFTLTLPIIQDTKAQI